MNAFIWQPWIKYNSGKHSKMLNLQIIWGLVGKNLSAKLTVLKHFKTKILYDLSNVTRKVKLLTLY